jgi:DNA-binding CsgD family transcriptional regulator
MPGSLGCAARRSEMSGPPKRIDLKSFLAEIGWGTHLCLFYQTKNDLLDAIVPYFEAGLRRKELCVWAVSEPLTQEEAIAALRRGVAGFDVFLAERSIEIIPGREWYFHGNGFDLRRVVDGWHGKLRGALARGYAGMRISGSAFWIETKHWNEFCAYEHAVDRSMTGHLMSAVCTFPLAASRPDAILEVSRAHRFAIARRNGHWEFVTTVRAEQTAYPMTPRELEVLTWTAQGKSAKEIGTILGIGKRTVDEHAQSAMRKLGAVNRAHAVAIALQNGIVEV